MKDFPREGGFLLADTDFRVKNPGSCTKSPFAEDLRTGKLGGEASILHCVYLFIYCLFIYCLFVCLLFIYLKGAVCWIMHKLCGLPLLGGYFRGVMWRFWCVSLGLFFSPVGLMQDVMNSLPSFLTYCYYCLYLIKLLLSIVSLYKPVC